MDCGIPPDGIPPLPGPGCPVGKARPCFFRHLVMLAESGGADPGNDAVGVGVVVPGMLPPQPLARAVARTSGPSTPSRAIRAILVRWVLVNDVSLAHAGDRRGAPDPPPSGRR